MLRFIWYFIILWNSPKHNCYLQGCIFITYITLGIISLILFPSSFQKSKITFEKMNKIENRCICSLPMCWHTIAFLFQFLNYFAVFYSSTASSSFSDHCMNTNGKSIWGREVFGEYLARDRTRETGYLAGDSFPQDEILSSPPPLQELLAKAQNIAPTVKWTVKY